jgi:ribonuclease G
MRKEIVINVGLTESRAAVVEDGRLVELYIEREDSERIIGNIYKGRVENVLPGMQAAFIDIGIGRNAFLYVDDALALKNGHNDLDEPIEYPKYCTIKDLLHHNQQVMVQVSKEAMGSKGARVVTHISLPGRYLVLMPGVEYVGISRRIFDETERNRLKQLAKKIRPKGMGLIVRTVAVGRSEEDIEADCEFLVNLWTSILEKSPKVNAPALIYKDHNFIYRIVRDLFNRDIDKFVIDSVREYQDTRDLLQRFAPALRNRLYLYHEGPPIFESYGIESQIETVLQRKVPLASGGSLVIDRTEALTSIDVNTGSYVGSTNLADTVLRTNLEAAGEIARQLRLRDIGGIVILDFIDMDNREDEQRVLKRLEEEVRFDRSKINIFGFTNLGLVEITRKKVRQEVSELLHQECPYCYGTGHVLSEAAMAAHIQREVKKMARKDQSDAILVEAHPAVAGMVIGPGGATLRQLEAKVGKTICLRGQENFHRHDVRYMVGSASELSAQALPVSEGQILELAVESTHANNPQDGIGRLKGYVVNIEGAGGKVGQRLQVQITKVFRTYAKGRMVAGS